MGSPSGVRRCSRRSGAFLSLGLKLRMPSRARVALMRLMMVVCSPTSVSRSRWGRLASSSAEPAEKGAFEVFGIEAIGLGAPVLPRHRHARGMNDVGFDTARSQPAGQPEAVSAGLEGDRNTVDLVPRLLRLCSPSLEQLQETVLVGRELFQRLAFHAR